MVHFTNYADHKLLLEEVLTANGVKSRHLNQMPHLPTDAEIKWMMMILSLAQFDAGDEFRKGFLRVSYSTVNNSLIQDYTQRDDQISPGFQESRHSDSANKQRERDQIHFNFVKIVRCISTLHLHCSTTK